MKRITAKIDEYQKDGETKGKYIDVGVILENQHGEYIILNPTVDLSGVLIKQRLLNPQKAGGGVMCNIFTDQPKQDSSNPPSQAASDNFDSDVPF